MSSHVEQVTILGATGQVGKAVVAAALRHGYRVRVLARSAHKLSAVPAGVEVVEGDLLEPSALAQSLEGSQAVISAAGGVKEPDQFARFQRIGHNLVTAMQGQGVRRLVNISGAVVTLPGETLDLQRRLMRVMVGIVFRPMMEAQNAITPILISARDIDWTLVRAAVLSSGSGTGRVLADDRKLPALKITLEDLASFMVEQVESTEWVRRAPLVATAKG